MKNYEKTITILISLALFSCLYLTGQSVFRTASRYILQQFHTPNAVQYFEDTRGSFSVGGMCGNNLRWSFANGILIINGKGKMTDYKDSNAPWSALTITTAKIQEGVTGIGSHAFTQNKSLKSVLLPSTLTTVAADAFGRAEKLPRIYVARDNTHFTSFSGVLFHKKELRPVIYPSKAQRKTFTAFPGAVRQITSCILYLMLCLQTMG